MNRSFLSSLLGVGVACLLGAGAAARHLVHGGSRILGKLAGAQLPRIC